MKENASIYSVHSAQPLLRILLAIPSLFTLLFCLLFGASLITPSLKPDGERQASNVECKNANEYPKVNAEDVRRCSVEEDDFGGLSGKKEAAT